MKSHKEKYKLVIDNETANVVRKIFKWAERGMKTTQIAKELNGKNVPTPMMFLARQKNFKWYLKDESHGKMWTSTSVLRILKDERYTGKCIYGRTKVVSVGSKRSIKLPEDKWIVVPDRFPVIISQERYDKVQSKLKKHVRGSNNKTDRLFSGNIRCGHCGYALAYHPAQFPYYQCHTNDISGAICYGNRILEKLDKQLIDCLVKSVEIYSGGKIHVAWKFSYFCDIMKSEESQTESDVSKMEISNRVWLYYCSADGWDKLNLTRQRIADCARKMGLSVVGESFDNAGISITATGFKEMQRAVRQGRVDKIIVPTFEGVSKTTEAYAALERAIIKRKVKLYDMHGKLIIGK